jgi:hypothetical protein
METMYVTTHAIMLVCAIGVVYLSVSGAIAENEIAKPTIISSLVEKVKSLQITTADFYRTATALLAIFLRS